MLEIGQTHAHMGIDFTTIRLCLFIIYTYSTALLNPYLPEHSLGPPPVI